ncbi:serine/threonine-protein kinase OSR1/STK39 [Entomortierella parvispora]|uniref:Serine/threonine-protein kinase OSR1/STK39 n=1 Tax=Entomortierella parvispora TaxID=205924 RepID=A0A9P3LXA6_9FUNG|nr:serine/threonine-protein kinase OSR1/STK39 [Entomortierella parvispora]
MERNSSSGSIKRPSSIHSGSGTMPTSPVGLVTPMSSVHDDSFSNNPEDYDIRLPIGYGSSAVVYNAYYKPLNRRVAIKVIDLDMFERNQIDELRRETQVMALCKHPNVLRVNGAFVMDSKLYIVTPYLSAGSCLDIMKTAYPDGFDEVSIATILKQALQGLDYLHKNGHIHRDVKAGNLLMDDDGSVLLADFGVSSSLMENGDRRGMRKTFVGTPCWMAPEVMEQAGYDYKADIWSFGITAIELATGHAPFAKYPPIKVLMLTLSNDPPTLDRESTKHRYSKLLKEMIDCCLQKDPARRPSAEKLLNHSFFKQAKKKSHLVAGLLQNLPPLEQRPPKKATQKFTMPEKGVSWNFDADDTPIPEPPKSEPTRRPRTVTFEPTQRPVSTATTDSMSSTGVPPGESAFIETIPQDSRNGAHVNPTPSAATEKPIRKSRFVVEDSAGPSISSPPSSHSAEMSPSHSGAISPSFSANGVSIGSVNAAQGLQGLQGLGVTSGSPAPEGNTPEVKKGRFSVKDTTLSITSPSPSSIRAMANDSLLSPSRSLSSSPVEGAEGVHMGLPLDLASSERKSRFEVHHSHVGQPLATPAPSATSTSVSSPVLSGTTITARDSSQSRIQGEAALPRDSSATRVSRFNVEASQPFHEPQPTTTSTTTAGALASSQNKRSRFQVLSMDGKSSEVITVIDPSSSTNSTPNTSPSGSLSRGQASVVEAHLDTLYRQNEQQRVILTELFAGLGLKAGTSPSTVPLSSSKNHSETGHANEGTALATLGSSTKSEFGQGDKLQFVLRENESLRRDNEALKRELERLRRGGI